MRRRARFWIRGEAVVISLDDSALARLREAVTAPDLSGTRYRIVSVAGQGGMGTVYVAHDATLARNVALKVLEPHAPDQLLQREAQVLAGLEHPGIVPVHDAGTMPDGRRWYAMKWVDGERLDAALQKSLGQAERLRIFLQICATVAFAHARGVLHRDLKPANIMIGSFGEVLVLDWGLAKLASDGEDHVRVGTDGFSAPEPIGDALIDVYSLGAILACMGPLPTPLAAIAHKATGERAQRYADVQALAADVARYMKGAAVSALPESIWRRVGRWSARHRVALGIVGAYVVGRALIFFFTGR